MTDPRPSTPFRIFVLLLLAGWLFLAVPLATGRTTLFHRDVFLTHFPFKAFGAQQLREGRIPAFNPTWALGQPFRGNPNAVSLYPGNVLYLALPFWSAFNLHYVLHWLLAGFAMYVLARTLGSSREAGLLAAATYAGGGWMYAVMTFYNILTVMAWWPLAMAGAVGRGRRSLAAGGLACGMALLGGEPVTALFGVVPMLVLAVRTRGLRAGVLRTLAVGGAGVAVALPQIVATARVAGFSFRGTHGVLASQASYYSLAPQRLLELIFPFPFGIPGWEGPAGLGAAGGLAHLPFYYCLYGGLVALVLALFAVRSQRLLAGLAGSGLLLAWLGGLSGRALVALGGGLLRSPEKLLFWVFLSLPLLAAAGLDQHRLGASVRSARGVLAAAAALSLATVVAALSRGRLPASLLPGSHELSVEQMQGRLWLLALGCAAGLMLGTWWALRRGRVDVLLGLQIAALLQLAPLWMTDEVSAFEKVAWRHERGEGGLAAVAVMAYPDWDLSGVAPLLPPGPSASRARFEAERLAPAPGVRFGVGYPVAPDLDGMHHLFSDLLTVKLADASWPQRVRWLEVLGVDTLVSPEPIVSASLRQVGFARDYAAPSWTYALPNASPPAWWPDHLTVAASPPEAFAAVAGSSPGELPGVVPQAFPHAPGGRVEVLEQLPDRIRLRVESEGGLVVVRRSFQTLWRAHAEGEELPILPADLCLLGVIVPAGRHEVVVEAGSAPEEKAAIVSLAVAAALVSIAVVGRRRDG